MFIRIKTISGKKYAYLCESVWREQKNQQVVKQYLGKIFDAGETPAIVAVPEMKKETLLVQLLTQTLGMAGFVKHSTLWSREVDGQMLIINDQTLAVKSQKDKDVIVKINDGYICSQALLSLHKILQEPVTDKGQELARAFVDAGFRLAPELFVLIFTTLFATKTENDI